MTAVVYAPQDDASALYRLTEPARVLGVPVVRHLPQVGDADVVVLNRPFDGGIAEQVRLWVTEGRRVVIDQDDCFDTVSPNHRMHGRFTTEHMHLACKYATTVTTSTPALAQRYGYGHGVVVRNRVPAWRLGMERSREDGDPWVVWYGSLGSHPDDPAQVGGGLGAPMRETGAEFVMFGPEDEVPVIAGQLGHDGVSHARGYYSQEGLMRNLPECDLGIVPLELSPFNEAKSYLKGLEMASAGLPVIASPTPEYRRMAELGACVTARTPRDWEDWGRLFLHEPEARRVQGARGKAWAATQTYELAVDEFRHAWFDS